MRTITVNGKNYVARDFDFNMICDITDEGIDTKKISKAPMSFVRFYVASCMNVPKEIAGLEIQEHLKKGGKLDEIMNVIAEKMDESEFFRG